MFNYNETYDDNYTSEVVYNETISKTVKFWVYLIFLIPSIFSSLLFIYYFLFNRTVRHAIHNHVITIVVFISLIYETTQYPWMLYYYHYDGIWHRSSIFCTIWAFIDWGLYYSQTILYAWASIERHILIFHHKWILTRKKRFFIHYLPLIVLCIYCFVFYMMISFFPNCENSFDNFYIICVQLCFTDTYVLYMWDAIAHQTLPNLIIVIFSIALLLRVLYQKHHIHRSIQWRKNRKMTIQLLSISILYLIFAFPLTLMNLIYLCDLSNDVGVEFYNYLLFFNYLMLLFLPFVCLLSLPEFQKKIKHILYRWPQRRVTPTR